MSITQYVLAETISANNPRNSSTPPENRRSWKK